MIKNLLPVIVAAFFPIFTVGQKSRYLQLIDSSIRHSMLFVAKQPVKSFNLDLRDTSFYYEVLKDDCNCRIDKRILQELIVNSKEPDTTFWSDWEIDRAILVNSRDELI